MIKSKKAQIINNPCFLFRKFHLIFYDYCQTYQILINIVCYKFNFSLNPGCVTFFKLTW